MTVAKSPEHYRECWEEHTNQLTCVFLEAEIPVDEWDPLLKPVLDAIDLAVTKLKEQETWKKP
jgi:hypothetical protein